MSSLIFCSRGPERRWRYVQRYSIASSAAAGSTTSSSEPSRKTVACNTARSRGTIPNSSGIRGKTAAPSGTSSPPASFCRSSLMSAPGNGGNDRQLVAVLDRRREVVEVADVLVVEIDVDETAHLAVLEQPLGDRRVLL